MEEFGGKYDHKFTCRSCFADMKRTIVEAVEEIVAKVVGLCLDCIFAPSKPCRLDKDVYHSKLRVARSNAID